MYNLPLITVPSLNNDIMKDDSGATKMYLQTKYGQYLMHLKDLQNGAIAPLSDNSTVKAPIQGTLHLYPSIQCKVLLYLGLNNESLLSIGQICNEGCSGF